MKSQSTVLRKEAPALPARYRIRSNGIEGKVRGLPGRSGCRLWPWIRRRRRPGKSSTAPLKATLHVFLSEQSIASGLRPRYNRAMKTNGKKARKPSPSMQSRSAAHARRARAPAPIWEEILKIARSIPPGDLHKLPTDLAANHDHYLFGFKTVFHS